MLHRQSLPHTALVWLAAGALCSVGCATRINKVLADPGRYRSEPVTISGRVVDQLFTGALTDQTPGAAVLIARDGQVLFERGYGLANVDSGLAVTPETKFRIGSLTKPFTAAAILKLQEQGKLRVSDRLSRFFPDWPRGDEITLYHLLTHTSGIHNYTAKPDFRPNVTSGIALDALVQSFRKDPSDFGPGQKFLYSNSGYVLLGAIVERASGMSYRNYLRATFFDRLGMDDTDVYDSGAPPANEAMGYSYENGRVAKAVAWNMSRVGAAGALYSTVRDLSRWNEALFAGRVLSATSLHAAFTVGLIEGDDPSYPEDTGYGYGWTLDRLRGLRTIGHGGELDGFGSYLLRVPDQRLTVVVLLNAVPQLPGIQQWVLARRIAELALGTSLPPLRSPTVDTTVPVATFDEIAGRYDMGGGLIMTVTHEGTGIFMEIAGRPRAEMLPRSPRTFFVGSGQAEATFVRNDEGRVTKAILKQGDQRIDAPRLPPPP